MRIFLILAVVVGAPVLADSPKMSCPVNLVKFVSILDAKDCSKNLVEVDGFKRSENCYVELYNGRKAYFYPVKPSDQPALGLDHDCKKASGDINQLSGKCEISINENGQRCLCSRENGCYKSADKRNHPGYFVCNNKLIEKVDILSGPECAKANDVDENYQPPIAVNKKCSITLSSGRVLYFYPVRRTDMWTFGMDDDCKAASGGRTQLSDKCEVVLYNGQGDVCRCSKNRCSSEKTRDPGPPPSKQEPDPRGGGGGAVGIKEGS